MSRSEEAPGSFVSRAGDAVVRHVRAVISSPESPAGGTQPPASGWLAVTVLCELGDIDATQLPAPLAEFGERIEVRLRPAPGGRGTELAARLPDAPPGSAAGRLAGTDPQADLRSALRRAKQLIEVGEVLAVDPTPHGERKATPGGVLLEAWTKVAPQGGVR